MKVAEVSTSKIKNVQLVDHLGSESNILGTVHITSSHFIFKADNAGKEIWVANSLINSFERPTISAAGSRLIIKCKHFMVFNLLFSRNKDCQTLFDALSKYCKLMNINDCYAFTCKEALSDSKQRETNDWWRLDWRTEFRRQGVNDSWKETNFNADYKYCDTYPEQLWIPQTATSQLLIGSCRFRSRSRLPVLTYFYKSSGASICRCSQPLSGFSARCVEDESLMNLIMEANSGSGSPLFLVDARPKVNAMVNKVQGKGFEDVKNYTNMQFHFFDIENIHIMRNSLTKLLEASQRPMSVTDFLKSVDGSGWLRHLRTLLECGKFIAESVLRGTSCVVHCSDGWDRTAQTVSVAQILLDPFYRTIHGFQVLLDKDWLGFGFKFDDRCAHVSSANIDDSKEISPIFTQFLDVIWQLMRKMPLDFEFNERFLLELNEHAYSCEYGTFIGNCDKDRKDLRVVQRTQSLWKSMDAHIEDYRNPFYKEKHPSYLSNVDLRPSAFTVWTAMYNRFDSGIQPREYFADVAYISQQHIKFMEHLLQKITIDENTKKGDDEGLTSSPPDTDDVMDVPTAVAIKWQSLLNADECSSPTCRREFVSRFERRLHCLRCGSIFCQRCFSVPQHKQKICKGCAATKKAVNL